MSRGLPELPTQGQGFEKPMAEAQRTGPRQAGTLGAVTISEGGQRRVECRWAAEGEGPGLLLQAPPPAPPHSLGGIIWENCSP